MQKQPIYHLRCVNRGCGAVLGVWGMVSPQHTLKILREQGWTGQINHETETVDAIQCPAHAGRPWRV